VNTSSPLRIEGAMLEGMIEMARARQPICITPFTLAGAMAPITLAGSLAQQNAEALCGIILTQMIEPGAPVLYGAYTSNVDMKTGAPAMGTPEYFRCVIASGQLARRYGIPYRSSGGNASTSADAQSIYETTFALWGAVLGHANLVMHAAGWLEGGLCASFEKLVVDAEILQGLAECFKPIEVNVAELALDAIRDVGPGGHFFGTPHTLERYQTAFYTPLVSDWQNYGNWLASGKQDAMARASVIARYLIDSHQPQPLDPAIVEALDAFVAHRKEEGGVLES
jgi:trimethylamine--corrinoid protein Co-methyltransferase